MPILKPNFIYKFIKYLRMYNAAMKEIGPAILASEFAFFGLIFLVITALSFAGNGVGEKSANEKLANKLKKKEEELKQKEEKLKQIEEQLRGLV